MRGTFSSVLGFLFFDLEVGYVRNRQTDGQCGLSERSHNQVSYFPVSYDCKQNFDVTS